MKNNHSNSDSSQKIVVSYFLFFFLGIISFILWLNANTSFENSSTRAFFDEAKYKEYCRNLAKRERLDNCWKIPGIDAVSDRKQKALIRYGKELIEHTASYIGPRGSVSLAGNGMNCQNCHLEAGTKPWGNNFAGVASTYPKKRARSGKIEDIQKRINDCFERSLNGKALARNSREMKAMVAYIKFLGKYVRKDSVPEGTGIYALPYLKRPADPVKGAEVYASKCAKCHNDNGQGLLADKEYTNPPLWGENSYNEGAGLFRLSRLAGYVKYNMPNGVDFLTPQLSNAEAWDVAAFINSQNRPGMDISNDWPDKSKKPVDHPFGPFTDGFDESQHKYGPFGMIEKERKRLDNSKKH